MFLRFEQATKVGNIFWLVVALRVFVSIVYVFFHMLISMLCIYCHITVVARTEIDKRHYELDIKALRAEIIYQR